MNSNTLSVAGALASAALAGLLAAPPAKAISWWGNNSQQSVCVQTARSMRTACYFDAGDNFHEGKARCLNLSDRDERNSCLYETGSETGEAIGLCRDQLEARLDACDLLGEDRYDPDPLLDPSISFVDPDDVTEATKNPYVSIVAGHTYVLRAGEDFEETVIVTVTEDVREIQGVLCRVVVDVVVLEEDAEAEEEDGEAYEYIPVEVTDDWFAQDELQNVYYCGEIARNYDEEEGSEGVLRDLDGSFESGIDGAKAGVLLQAFPDAGYVHRQEFALGEAEDIVQYVDLATAPGVEEGGDHPDPAFACAPNLCLKSFDFAPIDPGATEFKYYLPGTGFVLGVEMDEGEFTGVRDELVCVGDSLDVLHDPACEIGDPDLLLQELCELAPDAFCVD